MRTTPILAAAAALLLLTGCGGSGNQSAPTSDEARECIDVPAEIMARIAEGANDYPIEPVAAAGVRSLSFDDATIIAMTFTSPDGEESTGAWAIGGTVDAPGMTLAVDAMAQTVTDWPGEVKGKKLDVTEDGVAEATSCLSNAG
ncbi:hypothetical protein [Streptomyces sp. AC495_CC817]|uniref:hypothetical protein n=1 Tax=Streptomyces sp. AC495_CC817 TaxID=2823900 RepID=UPI001C26D0CB|nr:hypothetical protein [Streptomyces sp. AC495_CC817]